MAVDYEVLSQSQSTEINPAGTGFVDVWQISYRVISGPAKGTVATVTVSESEHNAPGVQKAIEDKIAVLDAVAQLGKMRRA